MLPNSPSPSDLGSSPDRAQTPNEDFLAAWNSFLLPKFTRYRRQMVEGGRLHADPLLSRLDIPRGGAVLDVGCGFAETCWTLAARVGPEGRVLGVDGTSGFLETARREQASLGIDNVELRLCDAQVESFDAEFDVVFSRFGTMFFQSPVGAFRNLRAALRPGGRLAVVVWCRAHENPFLYAAKEAALALLPPPGDDAQTCGPGPFSLGNPDRIRTVLDKAGFTDVEIERSDAPYWCGDTVEEAIEFSMTLGPAGEVIREAGDDGHRAAGRIRAALEPLYRQNLRADGVFLPSAAWQVVATSPS